MGLAWGPGAWGSEPEAEAKPTHPRSPTLPSPENLPPGPPPSACCPSGEGGPVSLGPVLLALPLPPLSLLCSRAGHWVTRTSGSQLPVLRSRCGAHSAASCFPGRVPPSLQPPRSRAGSAPSPASNWPALPWAFAACARGFLGPSLSGRCTGLIPGATEPLAGAPFHPGALGCERWGHVEQGPRCLQDGRCRGPVATPRRAGQMQVRDGSLPTFLQDGRCEPADVVRICCAFNKHY